MARDGSGNYSLPTADIPVTGQTASATKMNNVLSDIATALTGSVASDGQTTMTGDLKLGGFRVKGAADGTATNPAFAFSASTTTGIFSPAAGSWAVSTNGTQRVSINSTGTVTVAAPASGDTISASAVSAGTVLRLTDGTVTAKADFASTQFNLGTTTAHAAAIATNGTVRVTVASGGAVTVNAPASGIALSTTGVTGAAAFQATAAAAGQVAATLTDGTNFITFTPNTTHTLNFSTAANINIGGSTALSFSSNRNITIQAPASGTALTIAGGNIQVGAYANPRVILTNNSGTTSVITIGADSGNGFVGATTGTFYIVSEGATRLQFNSGGQGQFNAGLLVTGGRLQASDTLEVSGSSTLASQYGSTFALAANMAGSVHRLFIGDGTGWVFRFARRSGGVTTERLEIHDNAQLRAFSGASTDPSSVAFSATPTFDARNSNVFYFGTLTGNVTSMTISQPTDGQTIQIRFVQDATGGRTVALPAGAQVSGSINTAANAVTWLVITWVNSVSRWEGTWTRIS